MLAGADSRIATSPMLQRILPIMFSLLSHTAFVSHSLFIAAQDGIDDIILELESYHHQIAEHFHKLHIERKKKLLHLDFCPRSHLPQLTSTNQETPSTSMYSSYGEVGVGYGLD